MLQLLRFKQQRGMKQAFSHNVMADHEGEKELGNLPSVPPGCEKLTIMGLLTLRLQIQFLSKPNNVMFRVKLWGSQHENILLNYVNEKQVVLNLNIRSSVQKLSKYFSDMGVLCIQCLISPREQALPRQLKNYGWIFINFKRYIINFVLSDFQQTLSILDQRKAKIGEVIASLEIQMFKKERLFPNISQPEIKQQRYVTYNSLIRPSHDYQAKIEEANQYERKGSIQKNSELLSRKRNTIDDILFKQEVHHDHQSLWRPTLHTKGRAQAFLDEYNRSKPEHSEFSLIRQKFGLNCPSIEIMKLKLDEAILLSRHESQIQQESKNMHILFKCLKNQTKSKIDSLLIVCQQSPLQMRTETKISLGEQINSRTEMNYLYVLPSVGKGDRLAFEIKEARVEISVAELKQRNSVELKGKNGKKMAILQFAIISERFIAQNNSNQKQSEQKQNNIKPQQIKQSCYLKVEGWPSDKVLLKNKKIGAIFGPKLIYQPESEENLFLQVQLQSNEGQRHGLNIHINHLYKEENYALNGKQVKIISAKGKISDLLALASKMEPNIVSAANIVQPQPKARETLDLKELAIILENLEKCQSEQCNELMQSLSKGITNKQLQKLSNLIEVSFQAFELILKQAFNNNFTRFFKAFLAYHNWNHKYQSSQKKVQKIIHNSSYLVDLKKSVRRLKRSSDVLFGMISSGVFLNEFMKFESERPMTEQTESDFSRQELGKLIILLLERYPVKCIKLTELEQYVANELICFNLNSYLLVKISHEIRNNGDLFSDYILEQDNQLVITFEKDIEVDWGLAKLLLTNEEQVANSSIMSQSEANDRKQTERIPSNEQQHIPIRTQNEQQKEIRHQTQNRLQTQNQNKAMIPIVISRVTLEGVEEDQEIETIQIISQRQKIKLTHQDIDLPRAMDLLLDNTYTVIVSALGKVYEGVFIASARPQKVILFSDGAEAGTMFLFSQKGIQIEEQQIAIRIQDKQIKNFPENQEEINVKEEQFEVKCIIPIAKSPFVKLTIRSIRPTRSNYKLIISGDQQRKSLNFPNENEVLLKNGEGWAIRMVDQQLDDIFVPNHLTSGPYCFVDSRDKRVILTAVIEIEECWDPQLALGFKQTMHLIIHFDFLLSVLPFEEGEYLLKSEGDIDIPNVVFENNSHQDKTNIYQSILLHKPLEKISVKLLEKQSKQLLAEFNFTLKLIEQGIGRNSRYLLSKGKGYRLRITIFQIRHSWEYCKPDGILILFNSQSRRIIESWIKSTYDISEEQLIAWLRANFQLTLTEINIILEELLHNDGKQHSLEAFLSIFQQNQKIALPYLRDIKDEFNVFDYNDEGIVTDEQLRIAKKVFNRNFKELHSLLINNQQDFIPSPELRNNFIIDLSSSIKSGNFDYLSFLDLIQSGQSVQQLKKKVNDVNLNQKGQKEVEKGSNLSIKILEFENLSIGKLPCTFLFKVNDQILAEPIHKCYSYKYPFVNEIVVPIKPKPQLQIYLQTLKSNGVWDYKLLEELPLLDHIKVFGGTIKFALENTERTKPREQRSIADENQDFNAKFEVSPPKNRQVDVSEKANKDFTKSFWNKSLNETRQKWSQWKQGRKVEKQIRKQLQFDDE